jgi:hypothetical protein
MRQRLGVAARTARYLRDLRDKVRLKRLADEIEAFAVLALQLEQSKGHMEL